MLTVYSKNNCQPCRLVKKWILENGLTFKEINVDKQPEFIETVKSLGYSSTPVVSYNDIVFNGFNIPKLKEIKEAMINEK